MVPQTKPDYALLGAAAAAAGISVDPDAWLEANNYTEVEVALGVTDPNAATPKAMTVQFYGSDAGTGVASGGTAVGDPIVTEIGDDAVANAGFSSGLKQARDFGFKYFGATVVVTGGAGSDYAVLLVGQNDRIDPDA